MNVEGLKIGLVSFTDNQPEWEATPERAGVFYVPVDVEDQRSVKLFELVRYTRQRVDLLIVAAHWGGNWGYSPPTSQLEFGRGAGADLIFGHSVHVFRGIEIYQVGPSFIPRAISSTTTQSIPMSATTSPSFSFWRRTAELFIGSGYIRPSFAISRHNWPKKPKLARSQQKW